MLLETVKTRPYQRDPNKFIAARSGGGGFMKFDGEYRSWRWLMRFTRCALCGGGLSLKQCHIPADGMISNARYFVCDREKHPIRRTSDVVWMVGGQAREEAWRAKGNIDNVRAVYDWLTAKTEEEVEELPI